MNSHSSVNTGVGSAGSAFQAFKSSGSLFISVALTGLALSSVLLLEPIAAGLWEGHNEGKLFKSIEEQAVRRREKAVKGRNEGAGAGTEAVQPG